MNDKKCAQKLKDIILTYTVWWWWWYIHTSPFIVSQSNILAIMRTKQIQSRYKRTIEAGAACLRLVPETFQCVTTNCNTNSVSILKVDCPCRYTSVCYRYNDNEINNLLGIVNEWQNLIIRQYQTNSESKCFLIWRLNILSDGAFLYNWGEASSI